MGACSCSAAGQPSLSRLTPACVRTLLPKGHLEGVGLALAFLGAPSEPVRSTNLFTVWNPTKSYWVYLFLWEERGEAHDRERSYLTAKPGSRTKKMTAKSTCCRLRSLPRTAKELAVPCEEVPERQETCCCALVAENQAPQAFPFLSMNKKICFRYFPISLACRSTVVTQCLHLSHRRNQSRCLWHCSRTSMALHE